MKKITLVYSNAESEGVFTATSWQNDVAEAVEALVKTFPHGFNLESIDFQRVSADGRDLGVSGLTEAELALKKFCI